ncbi:MAG: transporter substrate-binding domain-containing protein [Methanotrichaceae archaeon]|nr:transporter substrate-binding domain-containing protein [Methanotrichaceae archaeon]
MVALIFVIVSTATFSCLASDQTVSAKDLTYITEQYPPYNYQEDGKLQGISVDLLEKIWEKMGTELNRSAIKLLPWTEGYERTLKENNTVLFTAWRIPEREQLFKWVGPVASGSDALLAKNNKNISIIAPQDLKNYKIGAIENDIAVQRLLNKGIKKEDLILETNSTPIIEMLKNGTIDAWAYNDIAGLWLLQQSGANASDYKVAYVLAQGNGYYAFNKEIPDSIVQSFQQALDSVKNNKDSSGVSDYQKILYKYVPALFSRIPATILAQTEHKGGLLSAEDPAPDMLFMLLQIQADVQGSLNDLNSNVTNAVQDLSTTGLDGPAAHRVLRKLLETNPNLGEVVTFNKVGKIIAVEESGEGVNVSQETLLSIHSPENLSPNAIEFIAHVLKTKEPVFTQRYQTAEGINATVMALPVFSPKNEFLGGIAVTVVPDKLLNALVSPKLHFDIYNRSNITDFSFWSMHMDGLIGYDRDESQIGKYLFTDPLYQPYPSLLALGKRMIAERSGHGSYSFQVKEADERTVTKEVYWTTVGLHGEEWRLAVTRMIQ